jgi:hypothetical protein
VQSFILRIEANWRDADWAVGEAHRPRMKDELSGGTGTPEWGRGAFRAVESDWRALSVQKEGCNDLYQVC